MLPISQGWMQTKRGCAQCVRRISSRAIWTQSNEQTRFNLRSKNTNLQQPISRVTQPSFSFSTVATDEQSTTTTFSDKATSSNNDNGNGMDSARRDILQSALAQVHEHGWTEDAIAAAVMSKGLPITMMGLVNTSDLISHAMQTANEQFRIELEQTLIPRWMATSEGQLKSFPDRIAEAIQARLTLILPFVLSRTWHDGMALGAMPYNIMTTQAQLHDMLQDLTRAVTQSESHHLSWGPFEQAAIGAVYVATELHLLTDTSPDNTDTWNFLRQRVSELDMLANVTKKTTDTFGGVFLLGSGSGSSPNQVEDIMTVASVVASSLAGAVVSLTLSSPSSIRAVRSTVETAAAVVPQWTHLVVPSANNNNGKSSSSSTSRAPDGTQPGDYDIVTPFPPDNNFVSTEQLLAAASLQK